MSSKKRSVQEKRNHRRRQKFSKKVHGNSPKNANEKAHTVTKQRRKKNRKSYRHTVSHEEQPGGSVKTVVVERIITTTNDVSPNKRDNHHRKSRSSGGTGDPSNISRVRVKDHRAFHLLFGPGTPQVVADILNTIWLDPDYVLVVRKRKKPAQK